MLLQYCLHSITVGTLFKQQYHTAIFIGIALCGE